MEQRSLVMFGLPESGKTTFLAALWHLVTERDIQPRLPFDSLPSEGDLPYLNQIANKWRSGHVQERTYVNERKVISMNLRDATGAPLRLTLPDLSGESFRKMWEERECDVDVAELLSGAGGALLFVHADRIEPPHWSGDIASQCRRLGIPVEAGEPVKWNPRLAPTQVQIVDILQLLRAQPLGVTPSKIAIILSAWDKVAPEGRTPSDYLKERMPLLHQYLTRPELDHEWRIYGVSAQGGDYEPDPKSKTEWSREQLKALLALNNASERIRIIGEGIDSHDLTEPLAWLAE